MKNKISSKYIFLAVIIIIAGLVAVTLAREVRNKSVNNGANNNIENNTEFSENGEIVSENSTVATSETKNTPEQISKKPVYVWGNNAYGQIGQKEEYGNSVKSPRTIETVGEISAISSGEAHSVYLTKEGKVYAWGDLELHQLGSITWVNSTINYIKELSNITKISTSYRHSLALSKSGEVYAWGSNYTGQIGDGTNENTHSAILVKNLNSIVDISAGYKFSMALKKDGSVYAWGANCLPYDQRLIQTISSNLQESSSGYYDPVLSSRIKSTLNDDCTNEEVVGIKSKVPKKLEGIEKAIQVSAGYGHGLMLKDDGTVWSFGCNLYGQLGNRGAKNSPDNAFIQQIPGLVNIKMISAGFRHSLALSSDGTVYIWGGTLSRDAGDDVRVLSNKEIVKVTGLPKIVKIIGGKDYSLAISEDGRLFGWGSNTSNILSISGEKIFAKPVEIKVPIKVKDFGAGTDFITAI